jgi:hypothetical protein
MMFAGTAADDFPVTSVRHFAGVVLRTVRHERATLSAYCARIETIDASD